MVAPHWPSFLRQMWLGRSSGPRGLQPVCFFSLGLSKGGGNRFRSESFALQIHWEVRGRGSGFQQHRFSRVWCSVSPGSSGRLDGVRHVAFSRQTQVRILQTQPGMCRRESLDSWCKHQDRSSCSRPKTAGEHEGKGRTRFMQSATVSPILLALENWIQAQLWISFHSGLEADVSDSGGGLSIL